MNAQHLDSLRELTNRMDHGPSGFFEVETPRTTVLFVDDEPRSCHQFHRLIVGRLDINVHIAANGQQALDLMGQHADEISVVMTDIRMPGGMFGCELIQRIKEQWPDVCCLLTTAYQDAQLDCSAADGLITKPWDIKELVRLINRSVVHAA